MRHFGGNTRPHLLSTVVPITRLAAPYRGTPDDEVILPLKSVLGKEIAIAKGLFFDVDSLYLVRQKEPMNDQPLSTQSYAALLTTIKERIQTAQVRAAVTVNQELVLLYWGIGKEILARQQAEGWGTKVIDQLASDLRSSFPEMKGLSPRNLKYMRALAEAWPEEAIVQAPLAQLTWFHNLTLLEKLKDRDERLWYARAAIEHGWSRNVLVIQIEAGLYRRQGKAITNFTKALPAPQSDLAQQLLKDPYNFDFLTL